MAVKILIFRGAQTILVFLAESNKTKKDSPESVYSMITKEVSYMFQKLESFCPY